MTTDQIVRDALRREAAKHRVDPTLPPATVVKARFTRLLAVGGLGVLAIGLVSAGLTVAGFVNREDAPPTTGLGPASQEQQEDRGVVKGTPLLLIRHDGWRVTRADQAINVVGELTFSDGTHEMDLTWRAADEHGVYVQDRRAGAEASWDITIAGHDGILFQYEGTTEFTALWLDGDKSLELRGGFDSVSEWKAVARTLQTVDEEAWLAAMPDSTVIPGERAAVVEQMLRDVPIHPGVDIDDLKSRRVVNDRYQLGAYVTSAVVCAWIEQWVDATERGDDASAQEAVDATAGAREWDVLHDMEDEGGWSEVVWEYTDAIAEDGSITGGREFSIEDSYRDAFGCGEPS